MKKLFFSAVALVAFSSVSMANTIEIEDAKGDYWGCAQLANEVYLELSQNFSEEEAMQNADSWFTVCMGIDEPCTPPFLCN